MFAIFIKILSIFSIVLIGFVANKLNWLPYESGKYISKILLNISTPCLIWYSMSHQKMSEDTFSPMIEILMWTFIVLAACSIISIPIVKAMHVPKGDRGIYRLLIICTNSGFIGFPLAQAVFGNEGLFLMIIANAAFGIFVFSAGVFLLLYESGRDTKLFNVFVKSMISVPMIAAVSGLIIFLFNVTFPEPAEYMLSTVGGMTTPLSMLLIGIQLPGIKVKQMIMDIPLLLSAVMRVAIVPAALFVVLLNFHLTPLVLCIVVFLMAMPSAAIVVILSEEYNLNTRLASQGVLLTTFFSLGTLPITSMLLTAYLVG